MTAAAARSGLDVLLAGATGLVGRECLRLLLHERAVARVVAVVRRPLPAASYSARAAELDERVVDFERLEAEPELARVDAIVCALGTTIKQAGSRERFRRVDHDYPLTLARMGVAQGARHFLLVSALGASAKSRVFYNRVKGELEDAVLALPYRSITIVRPSLLLGARSERRLGEEIAKHFAWATPATWAPVQAHAVAAALVGALLADEPGHRIIESKDIGRTARRVHS